jgi:hydrogenase nickel incorporation protein HypA/HybF
MHELALSRAILEQALGHAGGRPVVRVGISVGALRQVVPSSLEFSFEAICKGTACDGAELEQTLVPAAASCPCGERWTLEELALRCPRCGGTDVSIRDGEQLTVDYIEVEEEASCTARR